MRVNPSAVLSLSLWLASSVALAQATPPPAPPPGGAPQAPVYVPPPQPAPAPPPPEVGTTQAPAYIPPPEPAPPPEPPGLVRQNSVGLRLSIAPGVFIPSTGSAGFSLGVTAGYGLDLGPVIVTPGAMLQGSWSSDWTVYSVLGGAKVTLPLGNFGPFVEAALGYGHVGGPLGYSSGGLEVRVGGGFILFFSRSFALGLQVDYDTIIDTPYHTWIIAPTILLSF